jgi:hypothetical protein
MSDGPIRRLCWRVIDNVDYALTLARLRILDMLVGPEPETPADQQRHRDRDRLERAFSELDSGKRSSVMSHRADRVPAED